MVKKSEVSEVMKAMARKRWAKTTKKQRSEIARKTVQARWAKKREEDTKHEPR